MDIETQVSVQIRYTVNGEFTDALYYPVGEVPSSKVQEAEMQRRYEAQQAIVNAPPRELTEEDIAAQVDNMLQQISTLQAQLALVPNELLAASAERMNIDVSTVAVGRVLPLPPVPMPVELEQVEASSTLAVKE